MSLIKNSFYPRFCVQYLSDFFISFWKKTREGGSIILAHPLKQHISGRGGRRYKHIVFLPRDLMEFLCADDKYAAETLASDGSRPHYPQWWCSRLDSLNSPLKSIEWRVMRWNLFCVIEMNLRVMLEWCCNALLPRRGWAHQAHWRNTRKRGLFKYTAHQNPSHHVE